MTVENEFDVTAGNLAAAVLAATVVRGIDEPDHKGREIAHQRDKKGPNRFCFPQDNP